MKITVGKYSGFCLGVKTTIDLANQALDKNKAYCLGEIIHNEIVVDELSKKGMITVSNIEEIPDNSTVIFRAHGVAKSIYERASEKNLKVLDYTCGKIKVIHKKVLEKSKNHFVVIIGKKDHPEVIGTSGFALNNFFVLENEDDIDELIKCFSLSKDENIYITCQTTFSSHKFDSFIEMIKNRIKAFIEVDKSICDATEKRQEEVEMLSKCNDAMIIIGGKHSSNTKELYEIARKYAKEVYLISDVKELKDFNKVGSVGIMAGASTPKQVTDEVIKFLNNL